MRRRRETQDQHSGIQHETGRWTLRLVAQEKIQGRVESQKGPKGELASRKRESSATTWNGLHAAVWLPFFSLALTPHRVFHKTAEDLGARAEFCFCASPQHHPPQGLVRERNQN